MKLNYHQYSSSGMPLVILHGMFGNLKNWSWQAKELAAYFSVYALDLRNHGKSPHADAMSYPIMATDVLEFLDDMDIRQTHLLGHSMGGKVAMQLALSHPQRIKHLVVVDIAPVRYADDRGSHDAVLAGLDSITPASLASRSDADQLLAEHIPEPEIRQFLLSNLERDTQGGFRWRFNLPALKANYSNLRDKPIAEKSFDGDVLFIKGALSNYIKEKYRQEILTLFPAAKVKIVEGAGHWVHAEMPQVFNKIVIDFLTETGS